MPKQERYTVAIHEAGHAVCAYVMGLGIEFATIKASERAEGQACLSIPCYKDKSAYYKRRVQTANCIATLGGDCAEHYFVKRAVITDSWLATDWKAAAEISQDIYGGRFRVFLRRVRLLTRRIVLQNETHVRTIAEGLLLHDTLTGDQIHKYFSIAWKVAPAFNVMETAAERLSNRRR